MEGAPAEVLNARELDEGKLPERLSSALSSACTNKQARNG